MSCRSLLKSARFRFVLATIMAAGLAGGPFGVRSSAEDVQEAVRFAKSLSRAFRHAAEKATPSVVTIKSRIKVRTIRKERERENPWKGTPFEDHFKDFFRDFGSPRMPSPRSGMGSGVIIDSSGVILTNNHVVRGADEVIVRLSDGREFKATDIKTDEKTDLAVLRIKGAGKLKAAKLGNSSKLEIGDWVIAIGNPFELELTVSAGIISGKGRELGAISRANFLQTDAAINPGNSGGPLVNLDGEVVGINTAIASVSGGYQGIGFAIPINLAKWVTEQLVQKGSVQRAYLGVSISKITPELARQFAVKMGTGVLVTDVFTDTPAESAGFRGGDIITSFGGQKVRSPRDLQAVVERSPAGSQQQVKILRDGKELLLKVTPKPLPKSLGTSARHIQPGGREEKDSHHSGKLGLKVGELTQVQAEKRGYKDMQGVLVLDVDPDGIAAQGGIREGMLIRKIGKKEVTSVDEFKSAMADQSLAKGILLWIRTELGSRFIVLRQQ